MTSSLPFGQRTRGDWGGLVMLGKAPINVGGNIPGGTGICPADGCKNAPGTFFIEGLVGNPDSVYGGTDPNHNCGIAELRARGICGHDPLAQQRTEFVHLGRLRQRRRSPSTSRRSTARTTASNGSAGIWMPNTWSAACAPTTLRTTSSAIPAASVRPDVPEPRLARQPRRGRRQQRIRSSRDAFLESNLLQHHATSAAASLASTKPTRPASSCAAAAADRSTILVF